MKYRAAVVGCGFVGAGPVVPEAGIQSHAAAWTAHPATELVAICDGDSSRLAAAAARWPSAAVFASVDQLLAAARPDIVSVCTPDAAHAKVADQVLACPGVRAILAEKPLALDLRDAERLVDQAARRGVVLAVNYGRRALPSHQRLRDYLREEPLGPIELVSGSYVRGLKHNGTHWLDLARFLIGDIAAVRGLGRVDGDEVDPTIDVELQFCSGARGLLFGIRGGEFSFFEMDLIGPRGRLRLVEGGERVEVFGPAASRRFPGFRELAPMAGPPGGLADLLGHAAGDLVDALATGRPPACRGEDAVIALRLAQEVIATAQLEDHTHAALGC